MKPFFSIVIPCCNVGSYIRECLDSILKQPFQDWECLPIIEDSKDDTEKIINEVASADSRFRVFKQPRSGSAAKPRNTGLENAKGEYLIYLDGDDSLAEDALGKLAQRMAERPGADMYACAILEYEDGGKTIRTIDNYLTDAPVELTGHDAILLLYKYWKNPSPMVQEVIWRVDFLNEHALRFVDGLQHDDHEFFPRALYRAKRVVPLHEVFYLYRRQLNSITLGHKKEPGHFLKYMCVVLKSLFAFHAKVSTEPGFDPRIAQCWAREWIAWLFDWFYEWNVSRIPREKRRETLNILFADGFGDLDALAKNASFHRRVAVWWVKLFMRHPSFAGLAEFFFKWYFRYADMRNRQGKRLHEHGDA